MVNPKRVRRITEDGYEGKTVVYQMCRELRVKDNDALLFAQQLAKEKSGQLIVNYVIWNYKWQGATRRFYDWVIPSLQEVEKELRTYNIPLVVTFDDIPMKEKKEWGKIPAHVGAVVVEQIPLRFMRMWKDVYLKHHKNVPLYEVDAHNVIPVWETSPKQEFAARTIRNKIHTKVNEYLEAYGSLTSHESNSSLNVPLVDWEEVKSKIICDETIAGTGIFVPGSSQGEKVLEEFLHEKLKHYGNDRNDFTKDGQSNLSPYISHGNLSRRRILLEVIKKYKQPLNALFDDVKNGSEGSSSVAAFIEECLIRAELAENFCFYNEKYDSFEGFPLWAKETLGRAKNDKRESVYDFKQFASAKTHDDIWNAAQMEMVKKGKMHGYLRMYWAKKILEWSKNPEEAMKIAVRLNDVYELDGRDPNGYVGCAWSIGGLHDRPWFGRPIFGTVRYMAESGVKKRGDIKTYVNKWLHGGSNKK